ncbi:HAD hydrolase family protein [Poseidonocella pacifica]
MVFTDLDGTLLDHESYSSADAAPALALLKSLNVPVVLASSKTAAEIAPLQAELGLSEWPAIVENGATTLEPGADTVDDRDAYEALRAALREIPADLRRMFRGFGDMGVDEIMRHTKLDFEAAARAGDRSHSEPGLWSGTDEDEASFLAALATHGVAARRGGRFLTLSFGGTKAGAMAGIITKYQPARTLALGDAPNDTEMLELADFGVIVRNDHGPGIPELPGEKNGSIRRTELAGPAGWNKAVLDVVQELKLQESA